MRLLDLRLMLDELQERAQYDENIGDIVFDMDAHCEQLRDLLRRDWSVRVLDANAAQHAEALHIPSDRAPHLMLVPIGWAARIQLADNVWPELPESVRAEIGEKP